MCVCAALRDSQSAGRLQSALTLQFCEESFASRADLGEFTAVLLETGRALGIPNLWVDFLQMGRLRTNYEAHDRSSSSFMWNDTTGKDRCKIPPSPSI